MNTADNGRDARSRAARRLRNLTIGTAVLGVVATGGLSALAAATNDGSGDTTTTVATTPGTGTTTTTTTTTTSAPTVTTASGTGHASTGGS
jgi:hypothetical protein